MGERLQPEYPHTQLAAGLRRELAAIPAASRRSKLLLAVIMGIIIIIYGVRLALTLHPAILTIIPFYMLVAYGILEGGELDQAVETRIRRLAVTNLVERGLLDEVLKARSVAELIPHDSERGRRHLEILNASYGNSGQLQSPEQRLHFLTSEYEMLCYLRRWHYEGVPERPILHPAGSGWRRRCSRGTPPDSDWSSTRREGEEHQILLEVLIDILEGRIDSELLKGGNSDA